MSFGVTPATNAERVQMFVGPAHDYLEDVVQLSERQVLRNEDASPNRRAQAAQSNWKLGSSDIRVGTARGCKWREAERWFAPLSGHAGEGSYGSA